MTHVLLVGTSTRAAGASAARAGFRVTAVDAYADRDQHPSVRALLASAGPASRTGVAALVRAARDVGCDAVVYLSPFENHPRAVASLGAGRTLWGNAPSVLRRVRDPQVLFSTLARLGFAVPRLLSSNDPNDPNDPNVPNDPNEPNDWIAKPVRSGGGRGIRRWRGEVLGRARYVQQRLDGVPGSVVFAAGGGSCIPLTISRQLVGDAGFGAAPYRYCGSILAGPDDPFIPHGRALTGRAFELAARVAEEFALVGLNGIDFVSLSGIPYPLEVNPRWSASMEIAEQALGRSLFELHASACVGGAWPSQEAVRLPARTALGKAVVYAREDCRVGNTDDWLVDDTVRDVPRSGECFRAGQPVCTVTAEARDGRSCYRALVDRAARVHAAMMGNRDVEFTL